MSVDVAAEVQSWFAKRVPAEWGTIEALADADEVVVWVSLSEGADGKKGQTDADHPSRIEAWREDTREQRMEIAAEAERLFRRKVSWGARSGAAEQLFAHLSIPVMTRLRLPERVVLDTLVRAGVARSRSHALSWCARLVGENQAEWIAKLGKAFEEVERVRAEGPAL